MSKRTIIVPSPQDQRNRFAESRCNSVGSMPMFWIGRFRRHSGLQPVLFGYDLFHLSV